MPTEHPLRIYIAGPMTGYPNWNFPAFDAAAKQIREAGFEAASPAELFDHTDRPWLFYMRAALTQMLTCDAVFALRGWRASRGAAIEIELARQLGLAVLEQEVTPFLTPTVLKAL